MLRYLVGSVAAINFLTSIGEIHTQIYSVAKIYPNFNLVISFASNLWHFLSFKCQVNFDKIMNSLHRESGTVLNNANKKQSLKLFYKVNSTSRQF